MTTTPFQRTYTFEEYLTYDDGTDNRYELVNGELVLMAQPTGRHADIVDFLQDSFKAEISRLNYDWVVRPGNVGVRTSLDKSRLPDLVIITQAQRQAIRDVEAVLQSPPLLAVEVVSSSNPETDYRYKRSEYAVREIPEYWIVDPQRNLITVLLLEGGFYEATEFAGSDSIESQTFPELTLTAQQILLA